MSGSDTPSQTDVRKVALEAWLGRVLPGGPPSGLEPASADASFRRYFRLRVAGGTRIAMDAPPGKEDLGPYVQVAGILHDAGVNVPRVLARDDGQGFLLLTDLGDRQYLDALRAGADPDPLYRDAIAALVRIQSRTAAAAAILPPYDEGRLRAELDLFPAWFLERHLRLGLDDAERALIERSFVSLVAAALGQPRRLVHRDYHSRNLMVCADNPGILDFQDAVLGPQTYDLVSLLKDCYVVWPRERQLGWLRCYLGEAGRAGIGYPGDEARFLHDFDLMGLQRHLKVLGIFSRLWYRDGKAGYLADLPRVLDYVLEVTAARPALAELDAFLRGRVLPAFVAACSRGAGQP